MPFNIALYASSTMQASAREAAIFSAGLSDPLSQTQAAASADASGGWVDPSASGADRLFSAMAIVPGGTLRRFMKVGGLYDDLLLGLGCNITCTTPNKMPSLSGRTSDDAYEPLVDDVFQGI
jgi:hypothetical protein